MPTFNQKILDTFAEVFSEQALIFTEILRDHVDKKVDMFELINRATVDTVCGKYFLLIFLACFFFVFLYFSFASV